MPLIIMSGVPSSGKTTRAKELQNFFLNKAKEVHIISEYEQIVKAGFEKNTFYLDSNKEKHIRGVLKSEVLRLITWNNVVILDALNYIKGYRYELYCGTKANKSTQCCVQTQINRDQAWEFNEKREDKEQMYNRETFDALMMRYEEPNGTNRWDSPLFVTFPDQALDVEAIYNCLFNRAPPPPNMSTQNPPLSSTNFLYELDQTTKKIVTSLVQAKKISSGIVQIPGYENLTIDLSKVTVPQLMVLRRQYIAFSKMNTPDPKQIPELFVQYLNTSLTTNI